MRTDSAPEGLILLASRPMTFVTFKLATSLRLIFLPWEPSQPLRDVADGH
jgi:hypothetical protein